MKASLKLKGRAGSLMLCSAAFLCSVAFCSFVLFGGGLLADTADTANTVDAPVILIDPGHGGFDGGAEAADGTMEKNINLQIALKLRDIMSDYPVEVILTREDDRALTDSSPADSGQVAVSETRSKKRQDLENRRRLMEISGADMAISIHLNSFPEDVSVYGAQVFYPREAIKRTDERADEQAAKTLAENIQESLETNLSDGRRRVAMPKGDIIIFREPFCTVVLVECGFLSNKVEAEKLKTAEYQEALASAIWKGVNENLCFEKNKKTEIVDSTNRGK